jgi:hypothetical protein
MMDYNIITERNLEAEEYKEHKPTDKGINENKTYLT